MFFFIFAQIIQYNLVWDSAHFFIIRFADYKACTASNQIISDNLSKN